ncbi:MAG: hypothetical protein ACXACU_01550 [Candidatus Hodarchaeales archaeon]|jgi:hypothetical protein
MDSLEKFSIDGLDELDTQIKLFHLGVESFSPYASNGKVDMIIRSENGDEVRYADIKVSSGIKTNEDIITWGLEIGFFMKNESFVILTARLPEKDDSFQKHHFIIHASEFLSIVKKQKLKTDNDKWILSIPYSDLLIINKKSKKKLSSVISKALRKYFDNWDVLLNWRSR